MLFDSKTIFCSAVAGLIVWVVKSTETEREQLADNFEKAVDWVGDQITVAAKKIEDVASGL